MEVQSGDPPVLTQGGAAAHGSKGAGEAALGRQAVGAALAAGEQAVCGGRGGLDGLGRLGPGGQVERLCPLLLLGTHTERQIRDRSE